MGRVVGDDGSVGEGIYHSAQATVATEVLAAPELSPIYQVFACRSAW
jgi:hypothetical protein